MIQICLFLDILIKNLKMREKHLQYTIHLNTYSADNLCSQTQTLCVHQFKHTSMEQHTLFSCDIATWNVRPLIFFL